MSSGPIGSSPRAFPGCSGSSTGCSGSKEMKGRTGKQRRGEENRGKDTAFATHARLVVYIYIYLNV